MKTKQDGFCNGIIQKFANNVLKKPMVNKKPLIAAPLLLLSLNAVRAQLPLPTPEARPGLRWWWLGSAVDKSNLAWNMEQ